MKCINRSPHKSAICCCQIPFNQDLKHSVAANGRMERKVSVKSKSGYAVKTKRYVGMYACLLLFFKKSRINCNRAYPSSVSPPSFFHNHSPICKLFNLHIHEY